MCLPFHGWQRKWGGGGGGKKDKWEGAANNKFCFDRSWIMHVQHANSDHSGRLVSTNLLAQLSVDEAFAPKPVHNLTAVESLPPPPPWLTGCAFGSNWVHLHPGQMESTWRPTHLVLISYWFESHTLSERASCQQEHTAQSRPGVKDGNMKGGGDTFEFYPQL